MPYKKIAALLRIFNKLDKGNSIFIYLVIGLAIMFAGQFLVRSEFSVSIGSSKALDRTVWETWFRSGLTRTMPTPTPTNIGTTVSVSSPFGGETFFQALGRAIHISWNVPLPPSDWPDPSQARADLYRYDPSTNVYNFVKLLESPIANFNCSGQYVAEFPVPRDVPAGNNYVIRISSYSNQDAYFGYSGKFSLSSQIPSTKTVQVDSPNGGEVWIRGTRQTIRWSSNVSQVHIWWARSGAVPSLSGICHSSNVSRGVIPNTGTFHWLIPNNLVLAGDYKVWIFGIDGGVDTSNNYFSIVSKVNIISPFGGEEWSEGERRIISWFPLTGVPSNTVMNIFLKRTSDSNFSRIIAQNINNFESQYAWSIPYDLGGLVGKPPRTDFYISVEAKSGTQVVGKGLSGEFTIYDASIPVEGF